MFSSLSLCLLLATAAVIIIIIIVTSSSSSPSQGTQEIPVQQGLSSSVLASPIEACRGLSLFTDPSPILLAVFFFVAPSGNIRFLPEIGINSAVKAPVNIPVSWAWPCHLSLGTASLLFSTLPSGCSRWFHCARHSGRRNQSPGQEHVCIELAPFSGGTLTELRVPSRCCQPAC